jgi:hypothetical protein
VHHSKFGRDVALLSQQSRYLSKRTLLTRNSFANDTTSGLASAYDLRPPPARSEAAANSGASARLPRDSNA